MAPYGQFKRDNLTHSQGIVQHQENACFWSISVPLILKWFKSNSPNQNQYDYISIEYCEQYLRYQNAFTGVK